LEKSPEVAEDILYIHVFSHTHWDFEWYEVHEGFKLQLVHLIENLLDTLERYPKFKFHFDGQIMPIMDYLEIVRERDDVDNKNRVKEAERKISKFVTRGQLTIGPCWSTPETSLISFESLIRNINRGIRFSRRFGTVSSVFYNADAFQYHSQVPQIIEGAGLKSAFTWRGFKKGKTLKDLSMWKGADKTAVIAYYPPRTYAQIWNLPSDPQDALDMIKREAELLKHFAVTKHVLITQGNDQFEAQSNVNDIIERANAIVGERFKVGHVTLEDFFNTIQRENPQLGILHGELTGNQWACTMSGQLSARMPLKQKNKKAEIAIEKLAEPFATFAWLLGDDYPVGLMERAWEYLMKQHFHHCNACAIDEVHREGEVRYNNAIELASDITAESLKNIASRISSEDIVDEMDSAFVIFNPSDIERTEVVSVEIDIGIPTRNDTDWQLDKSDGKRRTERRADLVINDEQGTRVPYQILNTTDGTYEIAFWADKIPPFGYKTFGMGFNGGNELSGIGAIANEKEHVLENAILKIHVNENGSFTVLDKRNGAVFHDQNIIEDAADHGDSYNYDPLEGDELITTKGAKGTITIKENGPFVATYEVKTGLAVPERLTSERKARTKKVRRLPISISITLQKDSPLVYISTTIDNRMKDHRLRAIFHGVKSDYVYVQTQGDVIKRRIEQHKPYPQSKKRDISHSVSKGDLPKEIGPSPTQFQRNFVGNNDGKKGFFLFNKGLPEYETNIDGTIALTLLRAIGWLSQDDLNTREKLAGPKVLVPDAQCIGKHTFEYAILTQPGAWEASPLYREENHYSIQIKCLQIPRQKGSLPPSLSFVLIKPDELMVSAIKKSYSDEEVIIRLFNPTGKSLRGSLDFMPGIKKAWFTDLNEEKKRKIPVRSNGTITLEVKPKKIITISIQPKKDNTVYKEG
jgi:mannosylglycerate hydrolase